MIPTLNSSRQAGVGCFPLESPVDSSKLSIHIICSSLKVLAIPKSGQGDPTEMC